MADFHLPRAALEAMERLESAGYPCLAVGGFVRDSLLGLTPHDVDLATAATPEEMRRVFQGDSLIPTGEKHGTLTLVRPEGNLEITTFRTDGAYLDGRHPSAVAFARRIEDDLARRDFTINAMAWSPRRRLVDPFGGQEDLKNRILRCVGDSEKRFEEDALRLLRALRFAARFGLEIQADTGRALLQMAPGLDRISRERIREEITGLLLSPGFVLIALKYAPLLFRVIPALEKEEGCAQNCPYHRYDVWEHSLRAAENVPPESLLRWCALLHDLGKPGCRVTDKNGQDHFPGHEEAGARMAGEILQDMKMPTRFIRRAVLLISRHDQRFTLRDIRPLMAEIGFENTMDLLRLQKGDLLAHSEIIVPRAAFQDDLMREAERVLRSGEAYTLSALAVRGDDLKALGLKGPAVGEALEKLLQAVVSGQLPNEREALLRAIMPGKADPPL